ncbi:hypothetical protein [Pseudomonas sp. PS02303]|uniref:hypothetical protein n=1 Tax=Pseudomonas sp. PS02303 TaxID=2991429 RepID=UPI00249B4778|nr:hypothetical protein [Pseudomonas sp. PS02303]
MEDGGYYALKGFDFQIDKTIIEIFSASLDTEEISIERIQDLNSDAFVTQVKYKETQTYSASKIRDPVVQPINEFTTAITKKIYILYCYFSDQEETIKTFDITGIENILEIKLHKNCSDAHQKKYDSIKSIPSAVKNSFSANFQLIFAPNHTAQFERALQIITDQHFCTSPSDASFYYCYLADHLRRLVISNADPELRTCTRKELVAVLTDKKHQIFYSTLAYMSGRELLLKTLKRHFPKPPPQQNVVCFIGTKLARETLPLTHLITSTIEQQFKKPTYDVHPITFVINLDNIIDIKKGLLLRNITFNDGYEAIQFNSKQFNRRHISLRKTNANGRALESLGQISYQVRIITLSNFNRCFADCATPDRAYYFDTDTLIEYTDIPSFQINDLTCDEIWQLLKR